MTESPRTTSEDEKTKNVEPDPLVGPSDLPLSSSSSPVGVYDKPTTASTSSSNMMWIILLIVLVIVAFFILRQWM